MRITETTYRQPMQRIHPTSKPVKQTASAFKQDCFTLNKAYENSQKEGMDSAAPKTAGPEIPAITPVYAQSAAVIVETSAEPDTIPEGIAGASKPADIIKTSKVPPLPDFSKMSDAQKLEALKQLHNETDYSGMTNLEKYYVINSRVEAAFPYLAICSGYFGPLVCDEYYDGSREYSVPRLDTIPEKVDAEVRRQETEADIHFPAGTADSDVRRETFYPGMSDEEIFKAVCQKYDTSSRVDCESMGYELKLLELDHPMAKKIVDNYNFIRRSREYPTDILSDRYNSMSLSEIEEALWGAASSTISDGFEKIMDDLLDELMNTGG